MHQSLGLSTDAHGQDTGKRHSVATSMSTAHAGAGRAGCGSPAEVVVPFLAHEGVASDALLSPSWVFTFEDLAGAGCMGTNTPSASRVDPGASLRPLWGLMLGCFRLFLEKVLVGEAPCTRALC